MLHIEKSIHPLTEFTPTWEIPFWTVQYSDYCDIEFVKEWILENEDDIIKKYSAASVNDGGTGLGTDSLTAQYNSFNLFLETKDIPEFARLLEFIKNEYHKFMIAYRAISRPCTMYCWANVIRQGQSIDKHNHGAWHDSYLSGNMHLDNYQTTTRYYNPFNEMYYDFKNVKGGLTFFPSYIYHNATQYTDINKRVSLAFDLFDSNYIGQGRDKNKVEF